MVNHRAGVTQWHPPRMIYVSPAVYNTKWNNILIICFAASGLHPRTINSNNNIHHHHKAVLHDQARCPYRNQNQCRCRRVFAVCLGHPLPRPQNPYQMPFHVPSRSAWNDRINETAIQQQIQLRQPLQLHQLLISAQFHRQQCNLPSVHRRWAVDVVRHQVVRSLNHHHWLPIYGRSVRRHNNRRPFVNRQRCHHNWWAHWRKCRHSIARISIWSKTITHYIIRFWAREHSHYPKWAVPLVDVSLAMTMVNINNRWRSMHPICQLKHCSIARTTRPWPNWTLW